MEQKQIKGNGNSAVFLSEVRQRFERALGESDACTFLVLTKWLQAPVSNDGKADSNCGERAKDLAPLLKGSDIAGEAYEPSSGLSSNIGSPYPKKWELLENRLKEGRVAILKGPAGEVGGPRSVFEKGFHVVLFLSTGNEDRTRKCYVGFDPDISATDDSRKLWGELVNENNTTNAGVRNLEPIRLYQITKTMILGRGNAGVGPLIRKYYPDREKGLGKIARF